MILQLKNHPRARPLRKLRAICLCTGHVFSWTLRVLQARHDQNFGNIRHLTTKKGDSSRRADRATALLVKAVEEELETAAKRVDSAKEAAAAQAEQCKVGLLASAWFHPSKPIK